MTCGLRACQLHDAQGADFQRLPRGLQELIAMGGSVQAGKPKAFDRIQSRYSEILALA